MRQPDFANIQDVWGSSFANDKLVSTEEKQKPKKKRILREPPSCASVQNNRVPDIMSAYLDDFMGPLTMSAAPIEDTLSPSTNLSAKRNTIDAKFNVYPSKDFYEFVDQNHASQRKKYREPSLACRSEEYQPMGVSSGQLANTSMAYDNYYTNQPNFDETIVDKDQFKSKYPIFEPFEEEDNIQDIVEQDAMEYVRRNQSQTYPVSHELSPYIPPSSKQIYMEFLLYIFSGLILIFILEQVLQMGMRMRTI